MPPHRKPPIDLDRTRVVALTRFTGGDDERWSCTLCGRLHAASDSWSLAFDTVRGPYTAVICEDCAADVEPGRAHRSRDGHSAEHVRHANR